MRASAVRAALLASCAAFAALLSGCAQPEEGGEPVVDEATLQYEDDAVAVAIPKLPAAPPAPGERSLAEAPRWRLGEWWDYEMTDAFTGLKHTFRRVVAGEDPYAGNYLVGFPVDAFSNDVMILHIPGFGDVRQEDLAYETHDAYFEPLRFPLTDGKAWEMAFEGVAQGLASVAVRDDGKADVTMEVSIYGWINATYDPEIGEISRMEIPGYATYEVVGHGYGHEDVVRVPHAHDLIFIHGRAFGAQPASGSEPVAPPTETVEVDPGYDRASFIIALGSGPFLSLPAVGNVPDPVPTGAYQETVVAPDSTQYSLSLLPHEGNFKIASYGHENPAGTWELRHVAAGAGIAFVEGIGYHSIDVALPSGCVVASVNAQHHVAPCKVESP